MNRIQRKRTRGYKMPPNSRYVGRPTKWGNPFMDIADIVYVDASHRRKILSKWVYFGMKTDTFNAATIYRDIIMDLNSHKVDDEIYKRFRLIRDTHQELRENNTENLACFCPLGKSCHVDALLELLNI